MQLHSDGAADYVRHRPDQLDIGVRWICRSAKHPEGTPDQDALGMIDPATAELEGYSAEKAKGNLKTIAPGGTWRCAYEMGALNALEAADLEKTIDRIVQGENRA